MIIEEGRIRSVVPTTDGPIAAQTGDERVDVRGAWIAPGFVNMRASLREPGYEHKEDIHSGLQAGAAGGYTSVCALPDTDPVMDRPSVVVQVLERAANAGGARLLPIAAATRGLGYEHLAPIGELAEAGCVAVTQGEKPIGSARLMRRVLEYCGGFELPVLTSAVDPAFPGLCDEGIWSTRLGLPSRRRLRRPWRSRGTSRSRSSPANDPPVESLHKGRPGARGAGERSGYPSDVRRDGTSRDAHDSRAGGL